MSVQFPLRGTMGSLSWNTRPDLGIGVGLRSPHVQHILSHRPSVDWFEIIAENYMVDGGAVRYQLDRILEQYPVVQHGVGLYVGSAQGIDREHLTRVQRLARRTRAPWVTDHLCWGSVDGAYSHDLLPLPYTREAMLRTVDNVRRVAAGLDVPFALENVSSYAEFHASEMTEWQFLSEVLERADVGLLLDVNNIYVSSVNHDFDPFTYLDGLPLDRVVQIHIAGHATYQRFVIDTHDHPVIDPVWRLYQHAVERIGPVPTLLEWDARLPSFPELHAEARKAERFLHREQRIAHAG